MFCEKPRKFKFSKIRIPVFSFQRRRLRVKRRRIRAADERSDPNDLKPYWPISGADTRTRNASETVYYAFRLETISFFRSFFSAYKYGNTRSHGRGENKINSCARAAACVLAEPRLKNQKGKQYHRLNVRKYLPFVTNESNARESPTIGRRTHVTYAYMIKYI